MNWHIPSYGGDIRFVPVAPTGCRIEGHATTPWELDRLRAFVLLLREAGIISPAEGLTTGEDPTLVLRDLSVDEAASRFLRVLEPTAPLLTVSVAGEGAAVHVHRAPNGEAPLPPAPAKKARATATVKPPKPARKGKDCPETLASEVLDAFLTPAQRAAWQAVAAFDVVGHRSGHLYRLAHRRHEMAQRQGGWVCFDVDEGVPVEASDLTVPPPEEVLAFLLFLRHWEEGARNSLTHATCPWRAPYRADYDPIWG